MAANQRETFEGDNPNIYRIVHIDYQHGEDFQQTTKYGFRIMTRTEVMFEALPGYPGNESLSLYRKLRADDAKEVDYFRFCELSLRRMHRHNNHTVPLTDVMLDDVVQAFKQEFDSLANMDNCGQMETMITQVNLDAANVLKEYQKEYDDNDSD